MALPAFCRKLMEKVILNNLNLRIREGEFVALLKKRLMTGPAISPAIRPRELPSPKLWLKEPKLLLLDEIFASLDALKRIKMHKLLRSLIAAHRPGVLLVTHDVHDP